MKYAIALGLICLLLAAAGWLHPDARILCYWSSFSFGAVALCYASSSSRLLGKSRDGTIQFAAKLLLLPYFLYTWAIWHLYRLFSKEPAFHRIDQDITIGRRLLSGEVPEHFDHYIDLTAEFEEPSEIRKSPAYHAFPILDAGVPDHEALKKLLEKIRSGSVFIHCAQGHGRTGLITAALLLDRGRVHTAREALEQIQSHRPGVRLNKNQLRFLQEREAPKKQNLPQQSSATSHFPDLPCTNSALSSTHDPSHPPAPPAVSPLLHDAR